LVSDLNALLEHREQAVGRAIAKAGDLAHGLKTPLAVLAHEAARARNAGQHELAGAIEQQIARSRRHVEDERREALRAGARAWAAAPGAAAVGRTMARESAEGLARTLTRLYADRGVTIDVDVTPDCAVRGQREDLDEMLGNLLDNACKWARTRVVLSAAARDGVVTVTVDDDGPGIAPSMREAVLQRGV